MYTCMQAFEKGDCQLLGKIDNVLVSMMWLKILLPVLWLVIDIFHKFFCNLICFFFWWLLSTLLRVAMIILIQMQYCKEIITSVEQSTTWVTASHSYGRNQSWSWPYPKKAHSLTTERVFSWYSFFLQRKVVLLWTSPITRRKLRERSKTYQPIKFADFVLSQQVADDEEIASFDVMSLSLPFLIIEIHTVWLWKDSSTITESQVIDWVFVICDGNSWNTRFDQKLRVQKLVFLPRLQWPPFIIGFVICL